MRIRIIGAGSFGTTLAHLWAARGHNVTIFAREPEVAASINEEHRNCLFYPEVALSPAIKASGHIGEVIKEAEVVILAVPAKYLRGFVRHLADAWADEGPPEGIPLLSVVKGFLFDPTELASNFVNAQLAKSGEFTWAQLCGPNLSAEMIQGQPTAAVVACQDSKTAEKLQKELSTPALRIYTSRDVIGVEVNGAAKNALALACGMAAGLNLGSNARADLVTRGLVEMKRLLQVFGGEEDTAMGLSGLGDLVATGFSESSRNFMTGRLLTTGKTLEEIEQSTRQVAEGVRTARAIVEYLKESAPGVELPIIREVYAVIYEGKAPADAIKALMGRSLKEEK